ncbi:hypothetical protein PIB30_033151 [Stylosanthes scabra]|uniref:Uncharacterized protein n=1 Tax=Stylosanthes scabra TaxID=79078 RepID=A0ABU6XDV0_9FABA|nr:hypothetical protein [Stylosanthes scabra]
MFLPREALGRVQGLNPKKLRLVKIRIKSLHDPIESFLFGLIFDPMGQVNWLLINGLSLIGPVRNVAPTRKTNEYIRFPSSLVNFRLLSVGCRLSYFSNRLRVRYRPLNEAETRLYGWVEEAVLAQPFVVESDSLLEFRRNFPLMEDSGAEEDYGVGGCWAVRSCALPSGLPEGCDDLLSSGRQLTSSKRVLPTPGKHAFWLDHENNSFPWVYWNPEVKDFIVYNLEPLEMAAFMFLVSLPAGLPKRNRFTCRWILDSPDAEVGKYLDDLLDVKMKKTKLDNLLAMTTDPNRMASSQVPPAPTASETQKAKKQFSKRERAWVVDLEGEEGLKEDHSADLQWKRQKRKGKEDDVFDRVLEDDSAWKHEVDPVKVAFPESFNYRKALNAGLTSAPVREALVKMPTEQLLGELYHLSAKSLACLQVGVETSLAAKVKAEKELSAALDQIEILKGERDSASAFLPFKEKADNLKDQLSQKTGEYQSALDRITQLEEDNGAGSLAASLKTCQADLSKATEASKYWRAEWQKLGTEVTEMCQETLDICLDQFSHLCPGVDFSAITLKSRWDPKDRRIYVPQESDVEDEPPQDEVVVLEQRPEATTQDSQPTAGDVEGVSGECPT